MCKVLEEMKEEVRKETEEVTKERRNIEVANSLIEDGEMPLEKIAKIAQLTIDRVRELAAQKAVPNS